MKVLKISIFFILSFYINTAFSCSCAGYSDDLELEVYRGYVSSSAVVLAKAINIERNEEDEIEVTKFITVKAWKGISEQHFYTKIYTICCACGVSFTKGKEYLLYLSGPNDEGYFRSSMCTRTRPFSKTSIPEIEVLDKIWMKFPAFRKKWRIPKSEFIHN